jgi:hypothetical protein
MRWTRKYSLSSHSSLLDLATHFLLPSLRTERHHDQAHCRGLCAVSRPRPLRSSQMEPLQVNSNKEKLTENIERFVVALSLDTQDSVGRIRIIDFDVHGSHRHPPVDLEWPRLEDASQDSVTFALPSEVLYVIIRTTLYLVNVKYEYDSG